jgi:hypothetical protein
LPPDVWQPHWQLLSAQWHAFSGQPQEQLPHAPAAFFAVLFWVVFFTFVIVFLLIFCRGLFTLNRAFIRADGRLHETLQSCVSRVLGFGHEHAIGIVRIFVSGGDPAPGG